MKSNKMIFRLGMFCLGSAILLTGCKKKEEDPKEPEPVATEETGQAGVDSREATSENDAAMTDVNDVLSNNSSLKGKGTEQTGTQGVLGTICGLTVDSIQANIGMIKLKYVGATCNNRTRTGEIRLTLQNYSNGKRWKDTGAVIKVDYINYKITRASDQKSIMFNGTQYLTNVSGGNFVTLYFGQPNLVTTVTGTNLAVSWQDNTTAVYNINRKLTYSLPSQTVIALKCEGIGTANNLNNLENFGTSRQGDFFTSRVTTPVIWNTTCGSWAPLQGVVDVKVASKNFTLNFTYGVDTSGNPVTVGANQCPYGWKLQWTANNATGSKVMGYY